MIRTLNFEVTLKEHSVSYSAVIIEHHNQCYLLDDASKIWLNYDLIGFDTETSLTHIRPHDAYPTIIQVGDGIINYIVNLDSILREVTIEDFRASLPHFSELMTSNKVKKIGFAVIHDIFKLEKCGFTVNSTIDVQTLSELLGDMNHGMNYVSEKLFGVGKASGGSHHQWENPTPLMFEYAARDILLSIVCFEAYMSLYSYNIKYLLNSELDSDLFDNTVLCVNMSPHTRSNNSQVRSLIFAAMPIIQMIMNDNITPIDTAQKPNAFQYVPLQTIDTTNVPTEVMEQYRYYEAEQRNKLFTSEENTSINLILGQIYSAKSKKPSLIIKTDVNPEYASVRSLLPSNTQESEVKSYHDLLNSIQEKEAILNELHQVSILNGIQRNLYKSTSESLNKARNLLEKRNLRYNPTATIQSIPSTITIDVIISLSAVPLQQTEINSLKNLISDIQSKLTIINNMRSVHLKGPQKHVYEQALISTKSNIAKLAIRIDRYHISKELFLQLDIPIIL